MIRSLLIALAMLGSFPLLRADPPDSEEQRPRLSGVDAYLGIICRPLTPPERSLLSLSAGLGVRVEKIDSSSPAANLLQTGDLLLKLDDQWLADPYQLALLIAARGPDQSVALQIQRNGKLVTVRPMLSSRPGALSRVMHSESAPHLVGSEPLSRKELDEATRTLGFVPLQTVSAPAAGEKLPAPKDYEMIQRLPVGELGASVRGSDIRVTLRDATGRVLFSGPIDGATDLASWPDWARPLATRLLSRAARPDEPTLDTEARLGPVPSERTSVPPPNRP
jgi:hypothetical protein